MTILDHTDAFIRDRGLPPGGRYQIRLRASPPLGLFRRGKVLRLEISAEIAAGQHSGREVRLSFLHEAPAALGALVARDLELLAKWAEAVEAPLPARNPVDLLIRIARASVGRQIVATLVREEAPSGPVLVTTRIEVAPR